MKTKRFLAWIVTALMLLTSFALPAPLGGAREAEASSLEDRVKPDASAGNVQKEARDVYTGKCGPKLKWSFNSTTGKLTITGSGKMYDYYEDDTPWLEAGIAPYIQQVILPKGLKSIGDYAFGCCEALVSIDIPNGVSRIGIYAFYCCSSLKSVTLPKGIKRINDLTFSGCSSLTDISIPTGVTYIATEAFVYCSNLKSVVLPKSMKTIDDNAFYLCPKLSRVLYQGTVAQKQQMSIHGGNESLLDATWYYNVTNNLAIKTQPKNLSVKEGANATFKVKVTGATTIQWQYRQPNESTWHDTGVTSTSFVVRGTYSVNGYYYRCKVSNGYTTLYSKEAQLTVKLVKLTIKSHPRTFKVKEGKKVTFKIKTTGATRLQWQMKDPNDTDWYAFIDDSNIFPLIADASHDGWYVRCMVSNDRGDTLYSRVARLFIKIKITRKPKTVKAYEGETAYFSVQATGATGYQWQYRLAGKKTWYDWDGVTSNSFSITAWPEYNGLSFRCKVYNNTSCVYTPSAKLKVK